MIFPLRCPLSIAGEQLKTENKISAFKCLPHPVCEALFGTAPVEWYQPQAAAKTFPWGKVPRLAGAKEGGGMQ